MPKNNGVERTSFNPACVFDSLKYGFSQAVVTRGGRRVHLSGQVGVDSEERTVAADLGSQTKRAFENIESILHELGGGLGDLVALRIYLVHSAAGEQAVISRALRELFPEQPPVSTWILVSGLSRPDWLIEIEAEALLDP